MRGVREEDLDVVLKIMDRVGREVADDPDLASGIVEASSARFIDDRDDLGCTVVMRGQVVAGGRWAVGTAIRKRLNRAYLEADIAHNNRVVAPRLARGGAEAVPVYVPDENE